MARMPSPVFPLWETGMATGLVEQIERGIRVTGDYAIDDGRLFVGGRNAAIMAGFAIGDHKCETPGNEARDAVELELTIKVICREAA